MRNEANVSVVSCQSSVVPCDVEPFNEANVSVVGSEVEAINEANVSVVGCQSPVVGSEEEGQSSRPPASAEPDAPGADSGLEATIDRARMRAEFEKRSPKSQDLARWIAEEPGAGASAGPISNGLENPSPRDPPAESAIDA